jgi:hypothetical protein
VFTVLGGVFTVLGGVFTVLGGVFTVMGGVFTVLGGVFTVMGGFDVITSQERQSKDLINEGLALIKMSDMAMEGRN